MASQARPLLIAAHEGKRAAQERKLEEFLQLPSGGGCRAQVMKLPGRSFQGPEGLAPVQVSSGYGWLRAHGSSRSKPAGDPPAVPDRTRSAGSDSIQPGAAVARDGDPASGELLYAFGDYCLDIAERCLTRHGEPVALTDKNFQLLRELVAAGGRVLSKAELMQRLWPDTAVDENILAVNVSMLRKALGDSAAEARYVQTLSRRGYRFVAVVRARSRAGSSRAVSEASALARLAPFVGRQAELEALHLVARPGHQALRVAFVLGEAGAGKTALCERFLTDLELDADSHWISATGRCLEHHGATEAYLPFLQALTGLLSGTHAEVMADILSLRAPSWCPLFPAVFAPEGATARPLDEASSRSAMPERMLREMVDALEHLGQDRPLVLLLEDVHWADPWSLDLVRHLAQGPPGAPLRVLCTVRSGQIGGASEQLAGLRRDLLSRRASREISLGNLSEAELASLLEQWFSPNDFAPAAARLLFDATQGHPLFAARYAQELAERGALVMRAGRWGLGEPIAHIALQVPADVLALLENRLSALSANQKRALQCASVQGDDFDSALVAALLGAPEVELQELLDELDRAHRLIDTSVEMEMPGGASTMRYRFAHVLFRQALYTDMVPARRAELHRRTAVLLAERHGEQLDSMASQPASHFARGGDAVRALEFKCGRQHTRRVSASPCARPPRT